MSKPPLCIYHANCADGFCAAWLVWQSLFNRDDNVEFVPAQYGDAPPDVTDRDVIIVDFSYKRDILLEMKAKAKSLIVLDHHKTAQADLKGLDFCTFDMEKSGAMLTWEHLFPGNPPLWLVNYTQDRDLWRWDLRNSKEINAVIQCTPMDFNVWQNMRNHGPHDLIYQGKGILTYQETLVAYHVRNATEVEFLDYKILAVNATCLQSEIGHELAKGRPFSITWMDTNGSRIYSLRSDENGEDVSEIAKKRGGGGHKHAASFTFLIPDI